MAADCQRWLRRKQYTFEATFALNMFRSWEKNIICTLLGATLTLHVLSRVELPATKTKTQSKANFITLTRLCPLPPL